MKFKKRVKVFAGFYEGRIGKLLEKGETKYKVRFRLGLFRVYDVWMSEEMFLEL